MVSRTLFIVIAMAILGFIVWSVGFSNRAEAPQTNVPIEESPN